MRHSLEVLGGGLYVAAKQLGSADESLVGCGGLGLNVLGEARQLGIQAHLNSGHLLQNVFHLGGDASLSTVERSRAKFVAESDLECRRGS